MKIHPNALVICIDNEAYPASLECRKVYVKLRDAVAERRGHPRVIDESGADYLYPKEMFLPVDLPPATCKAIFAGA
jgi:hypothetical protein